MNACGLPFAFFPKQYNTVVANRWRRYVPAGNTGNVSGQLALLRVPNMSVDGLRSSFDLQGQGVFGLIILVLVCVAP